MKRGLACSIVLTFMLVILSSVVALAIPDAVPGEFIVRYNENIDALHSSESVNEANRIQKEIREEVINTETIAQTEDSHTELVRVDPNNLEEVMEEYKDLPSVEFVEPNYLLSTFASTSDTSFKDQYHLDVINARQAWDQTTGNSSVIIAIIDTGVDWNHSDLAANIWNNTDEVVDGIDNDNNGYVDDIRGYDFVNSASSCDAGDDCDTEDNNPMDYHGHGTHVSGIAAAVSNNSVGVSGVCWNCKIMPLRAGYKHTSGVGALAVADIVQAINYAVNNSADIISMSFGGDESSSITTALRDAHNAGVILIAAAGNSDSSTKSYPAAQPEVIAVASTTSANARSSFSNYGGWVDIAAPGSSIYSTAFDDTYTTLSGTSMSAPLVAGIAGLVLSAHSSLSNEEVRSILSSTAMRVNESVFIGTGIVNAYQAVLRASASVASFNASLDDATLTGSNTLIGTANGSSVQNYTVSYGSGMYPTLFTVIWTGSSNVSLASLASWDTSALANGTYALQLDVRDSSSHVYEINASFSINGTETLTIANNSNQTFIASISHIDAVRVFVGVDNDVYHLELRNSTGALLSQSEDVTVFSTNEQMDILLPTNLTINQSYSLAFVSHTNTTISLLANTSNPYADGNLSSNASIDAVFSLLQHVTNASLVFTDLTSVILANAQFSFDNLTITTNQTAAHVYWTTSIATNASLRYGSVETNLSRNLTNTTFTTEHNVTIGNLTANTTTYFNITACTSVGTCLTNGTNSFRIELDTLAPVLSSISAKAGNDSANISWITNESASSVVSYGINSSLGTNISNTSLAITHNMTIANLSTNTTYFYAVTSCDESSNCNTSSTLNFSTTTATTETQSTGDTGSSGSSGGGGGGDGGGGSNSRSAVETPITVAPQTILPLPNANKVIKKSTQTPTVQSAIINEHEQSTIEQVHVMTASAVPILITVRIIAEKEIPKTLNHTIQYLSIESSEPGITNASIRFRVPKNDIEKDSVQLHHYVQEWRSLTTIFVQETDAEYVYDAQTDGFSFYAITANKTSDTSPIIVSEGTGRSAFFDFIHFTLQNRANTLITTGIAIASLMILISLWRLYRRKGMRGARVRR